MTPLRAARLLRRALALATLGLAAQTAQASYVVGVWDPTYGPPFTDLGWRGTVTVDVPAACLNQPGPAGYAITQQDQGGDDMEPVFQTLAATCFPA